jgi:hypothetical protein
MVDVGCIHGFGVESWGSETNLRVKHFLEDNIKMDLQEVGWGMDWIKLAQNRYRW